jgi:hypothetical protein
MKDTNPTPVPAPSAVYQIKIEGRLDESWSEWFNGLTVTVVSDVTTIFGAVSDQAALRGILDRVCDLNLALISVTRIAYNASAINEIRVL